MKAYCISGLGANEKAFDRITFPEYLSVEFIPWIQPSKNETIQSYAQRMAENIDETQPFILIGLSFGGIIAQEMNQWKAAEKIILISTIKSHNEKPLFMKLSANTLLHKLIPSRFFTSDKLVSYTFFRKLYNAKLPDIQTIFTYRDSYYLNWSIHQIVKWKPTYSISNIIHIHGDKDPVFPIKHIKKAVIIHNGNHIMIMQKHKKISEILRNVTTDLLLVQSSISDQSIESIAKVGIV